MTRPDTRTVTVEVLAAALDVGIYPASSPAGPRTAWQDGWNAAVMEIGNRVEALPAAEPADAGHEHAWGPKKGWGRIFALGIAHEWPEVVQVCVLCGAPFRAALAAAQEGE